MCSQVLRVPLSRCLALERFTITARPRCGGGPSNFARLEWRLHAGVAQLVEHQLPKLRVVGSSPIARSQKAPLRRGFSSRWVPWCGAQSG